MGIWLKLSLVSGLLIFFGTPVESKTTISDTCFMVTSSGRRIDLNHLCTRNPTLKPARPPQRTTSTYKSSASPSANLQAFLRVIRFAEGTDSQDGYQIQFTGTRFYSFADHPRVARCGRIRGNPVCSTAAGAYQFLSSTWDDVASAIGARDFSPASQDRGAIELIERAGAMGDIESGNIARAIAKLAPVWASFPRWDGDPDGSYRQSVVPMAELLQAFRYYLQTEVASTKNLR